MNDKTTQINNFIASQNADREAYQNQLNSQFESFQNNVASSHNHNNLYYTESEIDTKLSEKANADEIAQTMANALTGVGKIVHGTYTGNDNTSKTFTTDGTPIYIAVHRQNSHQYWITGMASDSIASNQYLNSHQATTTWGTNSVKLTQKAYDGDTSASRYCFNGKGSTYYYMIICK